MIDRERRADYEKSAQQPWRWLSAAESLCEAAAYLRRIHESAMNAVKEGPASGAVPDGLFMDQQAHYFEGKCIGLFVKCLLIKPGARVTENGKMMRSMMGHDLCCFCERAQFDLSESETRTLAKLTEAITFWGTYPIPTRVESWRPEVVGIGGVPPIWFWTPDDTQNYIQLVSRLREKIGRVGVP